MPKAKGNIPHYKFSPPTPADNLPFEIGRIEGMPPLARANHPHRHDFYQLIWITTGQGQHYVDFEALPLQNNSIFWLAPGQVHFIGASNPTNLTGFAILFTSDFLTLLPDGKAILSLSGLFGPGHPTPALVLSQSEVNYFEFVFKQLEQEYLDNLPGRTEMLKSYLQLLLTKLGRLYSRSLPNKSLKLVSLQPTLYQNFITIIENNFILHRKVSEYAQLLAVTPGHLNEIVRQHCDKSAGELIRERVLLEAKRLLFYGEHSIIQIANQLNFEDPAYFNRFFKRYTGQSPAQFRASILEKYHTSR